MQILFVHGMGRTPLSGLPILALLRANGYKTTVFGYSATFQNFESISTRLQARLRHIASQGDYALIGHSLGGVLLRRALSMLPRETTRPKHLFLLGSPVHSARLARLFRKRCLFRLISGDCGQLLASRKRMKTIAHTSVETTSIIGTKGLKISTTPFAGSPNDGVVAVSELQAEWISHEFHVPVIHTLLPASPKVAAILLNELNGIA